MIKCHGHLSKTKDFLWATFNQSQKTKSSNKMSKMLRYIDPGMDERPGGKKKRLFIYDWGSQYFQWIWNLGLHGFPSRSICSFISESLSYHCYLIPKLEEYLGKTSIYIIDWECTKTFLLLVAPFFKHDLKRVHKMALFCFVLMWISLKYIWCLDTDMKETLTEHSTVKYKTKGYLTNSRCSCIMFSALFNNVDFFFLFCFSW